MALPLLMLRNLQIQKSTKFGLAGIFSLVFLSIIFDILRTLQTLNNSGTPGLTALWTNLESAVVVIVSSLPSFVTLISRKKIGNAGRNGSPYQARVLANSGSAQRCVDAGSSIKGGDSGEVYGLERHSDATDPSMETLREHASSSKGT